MRSVCVLLLLLAAGHSVKSVTLTQPASKTVQSGQTLSITCTVSYSVSAPTDWIRQPAGKGLEWIGEYCAPSCTMLMKDSLKNKFSISVDTSRNTVTLTGQNMQPEDTAVYYCARYSGYFDYWGKGTQVTVTSANPISPKVFPVMPCSSGSGDTITLACLATGFTPSVVTFSWTHNDTAVTDFLQYPSVLQNDVYSAVSQIRVKRQDWDNRHPFKCTVDHQGLNKEVSFLKPVEIYQFPSLKIMTTEENSKVTLSCLANDFVPNVYEFKWLKDNQEINDTSLQFTTPSKKSDTGSLYSAASFLSIPANDLRDDTRLTCKFALGRGQKQEQNSTFYQYKPAEVCPSTGPDSDTYEVKIIPPTLKDMLVKRVGNLSCEVKVKDFNKLRSVYWKDENGKPLMNNTDPDAKKKTDGYVLPLQITYDEWNTGIKRICFLDHEDALGGHEVEYVRKNDSQKFPSVFMLTPLKHTREDKVTLTCYIKDFYPKEIYVTWLIDDQETKHEFSTTNSIKSNGAYYVYSHLTIPMWEWDVPEQVYSCLVYHESLKQNRNIVRSIMQHSSEQTTMVNFNMNFPDMCKA